MIPISNRETGGSDSVNDQRKSVGLTEYQVKGKFTFKKEDSITLTGIIELPAGLALNKSFQVSIGVGNVVTDGVADSHGKVSALTNHKIKRCQLQYPKLNKDTGLTKTGDKAKFTVSLSSASLVNDGFDTEGITQSVPSKQALQRKIQVAIVLAGIAYYDQASVTYTFTNDTGQISGRSSRSSQ